MLGDKGDWTCRPTSTWAAIFIGSCCLAAIVTVSADSVVIHAERETLNNAPGVVRRQGLSLESCAEACAKETQIGCKFFKYLNETGTCLLSATDNPQINRMAASTSGTVRTLDLRGAGKKSLSAWISDLEEKVDELEDQESDIENLKSAVTDIRDELKMLRKSRVSEAHRNRASKEAQQQAYTQLTRKIVGLKVDGEKFKAAVHALSNMQRVLAKEIGGVKDEQKDVLLKVSELEKTAGDITTLMASLKATDSGLQRELDSVKDGTNDLATKFSKLRDRINQEIANKQMPPGMVKLKHNQGALATALESMTDKVSSLMARLPFLEKELRGTNQKVSNQAMYERELQSKLKVLYKNLIEIKKSVHNLLDPRSAVNMERAKGVLKLKSDVSMLAELDKGLKNELQEQREDMARLVKDVARVQLMAQNLKDKLTLVLTASRQFQQDIALLKNGQKNGLSVVEVAQMQKQVLIALNRLKTREAILMKQLNKYRSSVKKVANQVSKSSSTKSRTQRVVTQLQHRLNRFEKQMQLLFDRTESMTRQLKKPARVKGMAKLLNEQSQTTSTLDDLMKQLRTMRNRISLLSVELKDTKEEAESEKKEMAKEVRERQREMRQRQRELIKQSMKDKKEYRNLLEEKEKLEERKRKIEEHKLKKQLLREKKIRQLEKKKNEQLKEKQRKRIGKGKKKKGKRKKKKKKGKGRKKKGKGKKKKKGRRKQKQKGKKKQKAVMKIQKKVKTTGQPSVNEENTIVISKNPKEAKEALAAVTGAKKWKPLGRKPKKQKLKIKGQKKGKKKWKGKGRKKGKVKKGRRKGKGKRKKKGKGKKKLRGKGKGKKKGKSLKGSVRKASKTMTKQKSMKKVSKQTQKKNWGKRPMRKKANKKGRRKWQQSQKGNKQRQNKGKKRRKKKGKKRKKKKGKK